MASTSLATILAESASRYPDKAALVLGDITVPYGALWTRARQYAAVLIEQGIVPGDRVALMIPNIPQFPMAYYGALAAGAAVVPIHSLLVADEIAYMLRDSGAKALICAGPLLGEGAKGAELADIPVYSVLHDGDDVFSIEAAAAGAAPVATYLPRDQQDEAVVLYTSGTTGAPKGAVLTHDNILWNATLSAFDTVRLSSDDVVFGALPLFHSFGQVVVLNAGLRVGATIALVPRFEPGAALDTIERAGVTVFAGVPTMYVALLEAAKADPRRPQFRMAVSGGASLPVAVIDRFKETFGADIYEGYGLSETSPVATFNQAWYGRKPGSVGRAIWGVQVEITRPDLEGELEFVPTDEIGEIIIRGHNLFTGYLNKPDATAAVMVDGWFRSGDLGYKDADGFVFIVDRKKDLIIRGGFNVYPREVEEVLMRHPAVAQVAVVALPDEKYGEEICAVVVLRDDSAVSEADLIAWSQEKLGRHKYPRSVRFIDTLPLGPSGKILKREITGTLLQE
jgi:long-chain acyl-CoA synthetase